jgi:class 3 adenylate cyclase
MPEITETARLSRRLAPILATSRARLATSKLTVVLHIIAEHGGRIIDAAGYGILAEFGSIVNLVECTVALQKTNLFAHSTA